ncbi:hypothetical protein RO3G_04293 [Rhizopus delemar RA 99-880]|uniref:Uncharacterized protein n=1 Tax=Rhizopus delemar (strain RA 99-880 / ATCC MYA-4621 / FGSC 9543 / NRRL 43880) TaxID=246409 RepID=I1BTQ8_RHIO9|nr:hypothetical protein RO3G_04293 [Rhizopus delemar RA 99-880]|eukprot:EIE79588.1 hypothetical protein RO3G_04293 [Rhizopus delemar RA 99-880]
MILYHENGRIGIFDDKGNEANRYDEIPSFRLKKFYNVCSERVGIHNLKCRKQTNNNNNIDEVVEHELEGMSYNIVRASARLSNERIHESFDNSHY